MGKGARAHPKILVLTCSPAPMDDSSMAPATISLPPGKKAAICGTMEERYRPSVRAVCEPCAPHIIPMEMYTKDVIACERERATSMW